ncbi:EscU/YscU/HrcU family type III secretion system export apparatus switch protein [Nisaea denitrificans]|uniref:EscU/YscU/HrcU family type III secretion system export apparatus switch protein n=1 Tax=Nisaea denitrificans TaxID=390877 RepID=UPI0009FE5D2D|nr:EscU/YscU/HrcU family type III secretion system export apparatus switch protein [Nisaea denitrificans]
MTDRSRDLTGISVSDAEALADREGQRAAMERRAAKARREANAAKDRQIAIALDHDDSTEDAPRVIAKGYGEVAEKILRLAFENDVKVRKDPDLVQILAAVEVDCEIPVEAFAAVAEILTYVYRANERVRVEEQK